MLGRFVAPIRGQHVSTGHAPRPVLAALLLLLGFALRLTGAHAQDGEAAPEAVAPAGTSPAEDTPGIARIGDGGQGRTVVVLPIDGTIDLGLSAFVRRVLAEHPDAAAIVLDVDTFGGRVDAAVQIRDALLAAKPPVIAYIENRAISAGALISYAADSIVFAPGASMGAVTPITMENGAAEAVDEKMTSYMRAEMRATAEANGRRGDIAEAMVDHTLGLAGVIEAGKLLTVTSDEAIEIGLADGTAPTLDALLTDLGLESASRVRVEESWAEHFARFVTDPAVSGILMSIGMLGLAVELYTPGFGITGAIGLACLSLFFGGHMIADLAGWEETVALLIGLVLLGVEIFVTPGFGLVGISGLVLIVGALAMALVGPPIGVSWSAGLLEAAFTRVLVSLALTLIGGALVVRFLPTRVLPNWLVLRARLSSGSTTATSDEVRSNPAQEFLVGHTGHALTDLRPAGKARIEGQVVDVVSHHEYIERGAAIEVVEVEGIRVVVQQIPPTP